MNDRTLLRICGVLFCALAVSNFTKFLEFDAHQGFMLFGMRQHGTPNLVYGWLFGLYLLIYGIGVLRMRAYALSMGRFYAGYVILNLMLFTIRMPAEAFANPLFGLVYIIVAVGVSSGAVRLLAKNRASLA
jgi:uncharacterized transporter YbjL